MDLGVHCVRASIRVRPGIRVRTLNHANEVADGAPRLEVGGAWDPAVGALIGVHGEGDNLVFRVRRPKADVVGVTLAAKKAPLIVANSPGTARRRKHASDL
ncbi:MAG: hypothetical protein ACJAZO_000473 [Myxococcota bacterium]